MNFHSDKVRKQDVYLETKNLTLFADGELVQVFINSFLKGRVYHPAKAHGNCSISMEISSVTLPS